MLLRVIGTPRLEVHGSEFRLNRNETLALAYMALHPQACSRTELSALLWPGRTPSDAGHSLSQLLYSLKTKRGIAITTEGDGLRPTELETDFGLLRAHLDAGEYISALQLLQGTFLHMVGSTSGEIARWRDEMDAIISQLAGMAVRSALQSSADDHPELVTACEHVLKYHPHLHDEWLLLIKAALQVGQMDRARRLYAEYQSGLDGESLPPFNDLIQSSGVTPTAPLLPATDKSIRFVGRELELKVLVSDWHEVQSGSGCTRVIWGEPGIGKTRLAIQLLRRVAISGGTTWMTRCHAATQRLPFYAIKTLLEDSNSAAAAAVDELTMLMGSSAIGEISGSGNERLKHALVKTLTDVVLNEAESKPLVIFVDDVQWADDFTALLLSYWSYRLKSSRVLLLQTVRTHDTAPSPQWINTELAGARHLELCSLDAEEAEALVSAYERTINRVIPAASRAMALRYSAGRPFLLLETLAAVLTDPTASPANLAPSVETMLMRRFGGLSSDCEWVIGIMGVVGRPMSAAELADFSTLSDSSVAAALNALHNKGILEWSQGLLQFPHDLMRETAYRQVSPGTRSLLHSRVALLLASQGEADGLVAQHLAASGDKAGCGRHSLQAAETALRSNLYSDSEFYYRLALRNGADDHHPIAAEGLIRVLLMLGRIQDVQELMPTLPPTSSSPQLTLLIAVVKLELDLYGGCVSTDDLVRHARHVLTQCSAISAADLATVGSTLLDIAMDAGATDIGSEAVAALEQAAAESSTGDFSCQVQALAASWDTISAGPMAAEERLARLTVPSSVTLSAMTLGLLSSANALAAFYAGRLERALELYADALAHAETAGDGRRQDAMRTNWALVCMELGSFTEARNVFDSAVMSPRLTSRLRAFQNLAVLHYEQTDFVLAAQAANAVLLHNKSYNAPTFNAAAHAIHGFCELAKGDVVAASRRLAEIENISMEPSNALDDNSYTLGFVARMTAMNGNVDQALSMLAEAADKKRPIDAICALRLECEAARILATHDPDKAHALAKKVLAKCEVFGAQLIAAQARQVLMICRLSV